MIGFLKWLWNQYQCYTLEKICKQDDVEKADLFMRNYKECIEVGFSESQIMALMNLLSIK